MVIKKPNLIPRSVGRSGKVYRTVMAAGLVQWNMKAWLAGLHGRKWRENIKYEGKAIGKWLSEHDHDPSSQRAVSSSPEPVLHATRIRSVNVENSGSSVGADNRLDTSVVTPHVGAGTSTNVHLTTAPNLERSRIEIVYHC